MAGDLASTPLSRSGLAIEGVIRLAAEQLHETCRHRREAFEQFVPHLDRVDLTQVRLVVASDLAKQEIRHGEWPRRLVNAHQSPLIRVDAPKQAKRLLAHRRPLPQDLTQARVSVVALEGDDVTVDIGQRRSGPRGVRRRLEDAPIAVQIGLSFHVAEVADDLEDRPFPPAPAPKATVSSTLL